jgi:hypothetical protein
MSLNGYCSQMAGQAEDSAKEDVNETALSYSATDPALRSPAQERQSHCKQCEATTGW